MGVWSSISFCHFGTRKSGGKSYITRKANLKQILNVDPDKFSSTLLQDVQEFRIQESFSDNSTEILIPSDNKELQKLATNFEYSMGGNLKFYKKHLEQNFSESKTFCLQRQRKVSLSDHDSDPESLRYSRKSPQSTVDVITEERDAELSFDNYSTIYQPEFLLNIKSHSLIKKPPCKARETRQVVKTIEPRNDKRNQATGIPTKMPFEERKVASNLEPSTLLNTVQDINEQPSFEYVDYSHITKKEVAKEKEDKFPLSHDAVPSRKELFMKEKKFLESGQKMEEEVKKSFKSKMFDKVKKIENKSGSNVNINGTTDIASINLDENEEDNLSLRLNELNIFTSEDTFWYSSTKIKNNDEVNSRNETTQLYPESPIAEVNFFKTPCSTRHNSLESLADMEKQNDGTCKKESPGKLKGDLSRSSVQVEDDYHKLPKEFQEIARRLSKRDALKTYRPSLNQLSSSQTFSCSSSTCSIISPRSPSGRTISRTPSYKMPKTPSLSRQHPATYVTQHTSSRSRPASRVSSRAPSPTPDNWTGSIGQFRDHSWKTDSAV